MLMQTLQDLKDFINSKHKPELAERSGMVYQIWEDGEITLQKSGELLWQRNLHCIKSGIINILRKEDMPVVLESHGYAFIESEEVGNQIRKKMLDFNNQMLEFIKKDLLS